MPSASIQIPASMAGLRFDRALAQLVPDRTRSQLQKMVRRGDVLLDGKRVVRSNFPLRGGETVRIRGMEEVPASAEPSRAAELHFLEVADSFAVLDKPAGLLTHPLDHVRCDSVSDRLVERFGPLPTVEDEPRPGIVHRLDRETSGLLVIARTDAALDELRRQFRERCVSKRYLAWVEGRPREDAFQVDAALAPDPRHRDRQRVDARGKPAVTEFQVLSSEGHASLVECRPLHGRRHQIRVHLAESGCPIWADRLYGSKRAGRQRLHAAGLAFDDPEDGTRRTYESPLPPDMLALS